MTPIYPLPRAPEDIVPALLKHLNSLDTEIMLHFYDSEAMLVDAAGVPQVGRVPSGKNSLNILAWDYRCR